MTREDRVLSLFAGANPVPDSTTLTIDQETLARLEANEQWSPIMDTNLRSTERPTPERTPETRTPRRRSLLVAMGAAAVTILLIGSLTAILTNAASEPVAQELEPVETVLSAYEALIGGDIDAWLGHFTDDAAIFESTKHNVASIYGVLGAANYRVEFDEACHLIEPTDQGASQVECTITETNDFHAAGGISLTRTETFVLSGDGVITDVDAVVIAFTQPGYWVFTEAFWDWLREVHPDVFAEIKPQLTTHLPSEPESMRRMLDYVDEFLTQSDEYPIRGDT